jgi:hypothetical protein
VLQVKEEARWVRAAAGKLDSVRGGSGGGGATWRGGEKPPEAGQAVGAALEGTWRKFKRRGAAGARETAGEGGGVGRENTERGRSWRLKTGTCLQFSKNEGTPL